MKNTIVRPGKPDCGYNIVNPLVYKKIPPFMLIITLLGLLHASAFVLFWVTNSLYYAEVNNFLFEKLGKRFDYIRLFLVLSSLLIFWSIVTLAILKGRDFKPSWFHWFSIAAIVVYIAFFYGGFWTLFQQSPGQWVRLLRLIEYFRLIPDVLVLVGLAWVLRVIGSGMTTKLVNFAWGKPLVGLVCALIFIFVWNLILRSPPTSVFKAPLPPKPLIIAHRGAAMLAPENTLTSAQRAEALGAYGYETDIRISRDGIPFLMHDNNLKRTTDVEAVFPERASDRPENFTWAELKQLNAGEWFVRADPYRTIASGLINLSEVQEMRGERIPTLAEVLDLLRDNELVFIFDLLSPPAGHPYHAQFFEICFSLIQQAGIDDRVWFLAKGSERDWVASLAPEMILTYGADYANPPEPGELIKGGYQIVNVDYSLPTEYIKRYQQVGLKVNLYVVDEPWMFSRFWLAGVDSMTTNNVHSMVALTQPVFGMPHKLYLVLWVMAGIIGLGAALSFLAI